MPLKFYKPTPANTGTACSFSFNSKEGSMYVNFVRQTAWDNSKKTGSFKGGKQCAVKFSLYEMGEFLHTLKKGKPFGGEKGGYHQFPGDSIATQIQFAPYSMGPEGQKVVKGFGLSIKKTNKQDSSAEPELFRIGFTFGEAEVLQQFVINAMDHILDAIYSKDKQEYLAAKDAQNKPEAKPEAAKPAQKKKEPKKEPAEADPFADVGGDDPFAGMDTPSVTPTTEKVDATTPSAENQNTADGEVF